jgi:hypothetical protein
MAVHIERQRSETTLGKSTAHFKIVFFKLAGAMTDQEDRERFVGLR